MIKEPLNSQQALYVGVDVGGTNIECGVVTASGKVITRSHSPTVPADGADAVLERMVRVVQEAMKALPPYMQERVTAVGVGVPGHVDAVHGISRLAVNLGWRDLPVAAKLKSALKLPVFIENDVKAYIYGEAMFGAGRGERHVFGLTLGTGLASAYIIDGQIMRGADNLAGEMGHIPFDGIPYPCNCGHTGCLETLVSATGIARQAIDAVRSGASTSLRDLYDRPERLTARDVALACESGDQMAAAILERTGRTLGQALAYIVPVLNPDVIVIGGGAAKAGPSLLEPMRQELNSRLFPMFSSRLKIRTAELGSEAGIVGNAMIAKNQSMQK